MNTLERKMVGVLADLRERHEVIGVKAEFEAEGTRLEEALRLKEVVMKAGLGLTIKIGGAEALRDMYEARVIGVSKIVAPMVESPYALKKYLTAVRLAFPADERGDTQCFVNIETVTACREFDAMLSLPETDGLHGIVFGRVDMSGSLGLGRDDINSRTIFEFAREAFMKAKNRSKPLLCGIGGGVSAHSLPFFRELPHGTLDYYETRKVVFGCPGALGPGAEHGILKAVGFELLWLKNKRDYYSMISGEDEQRIGLLESRYRALIEAAGGLVE